MDDSKAAMDDAHGGTAATTPEIMQTFPGFEDTELHNGADPESPENYVVNSTQIAEHFPENRNPEELANDRILLVEDKIHAICDVNVKYPCSDSIIFSSALSDAEAGNGTWEEESSNLVPEMPYSAENGFGEEELSNGLMREGNTHEEHEIKYNVKEVEVPANNDNEEMNGAFMVTVVQPSIEMRELLAPDGVHEAEAETPSKSFLLDANDITGNESGTEEEQTAFMKELETFHRERCLDYKPPKFYQEPLNCLKLWRAVVRLGGYEQVTSSKLWRQVGESFRPPKTCTTVSWTFRGFYEKALLEYEKFKMRSGVLTFTIASLSDPVSGNQVDINHASGSGRARRDAAARAMQGWHSQRLLGNGEVGDPVIKDKTPVTSLKREKHLRNIGFLKRRDSYPVEHAVKVARVAPKVQQEMIIDVGVPADWVKVNVQKTKDCFEVYALVPGFLREEVRVQSDPAGRLVLSGQPEQQDNPWGVTPFKKVISLPTRIDPHLTSAVVTLHGQLFVRVPFEQSDV